MGEPLVPLGGLPTDAAPQSGVQSSKDAAYWRDRLKKDLQARRDLEPWWDANDKAYAPIGTETPQSYGENINTGRDFTLTQRKQADMFTRRPEVTLAPSPLMEGPVLNADGTPLMGPPDAQGQAQPVMAVGALASHEQIVNEHLGPEHVNAVPMVHATLFDVLQLSGVGFTVMGYEQAAVTVDSGKVDPLTGQPVMVDVPVKASCFWTHVSPKRAIVPHDFRSTDWDAAPYLGHQFTLPLTEANRAKYRLPPDFTSKKADATQYFDRGGSTTTSDDVFTGIEVWYRSCLFRPDRPHPDHLTHLVLVDGLDGPNGEIAIEEDCPYQTLKGNELSPDSLIGFPLHPLNTRTRTDSSWPPSDATMWRPLVNELNVYREQSVQFRDASTMKWMFNVATLPEAAVAKIVRAPIGGMIGVPPEAFEGEAIRELPQGSIPRENFAGADHIDNDIARIAALDAAQQGVSTGGEGTATEAQITQGNANARLDFERSVVLQWYVNGVTKYATLLQRYLPVADAAKIVGPQAAQTWDVWRKTATASLAFTAMPDSALRVDQAVDRKDWRDFFAFVANDPWVQKGRGKLLEKGFRKHHIDPTGIVMPPDPPQPEQPKISLAIKAEDLNPYLPQYANIYQILSQNGTKNLVPPPVDPATAMMMQQQAQAAAAAAKANKPETEHGGKVAEVESLSKHATDATGGMQGLGGRAAMGAAGGHLQ